MSCRPSSCARISALTSRGWRNLGRVVGPALGALLVLWSLGLVFLGAALSLLVGSLAVILFLPETWSRGSSAEDDDEEEEGLTALAPIFRDGRLAGLLMPIAALAIAASWIESVLPLYAANAGGMTPSGVGLLFTYAAALSALLGLPLTEASARWPGFAIILASGVALALAFGALLVPPALTLLMVAVSLAALSDLLSGPLTQTVVTELAPSNARATYMAAFAVAGDLKDAAGPAIGTCLYAVAVRLPWLIGVPVALVAAVALALAAHRHETRQT